MDKDTRNAIERATQRARKLLEDDFAAQLEGDFDVHRDGTVAAKAGGHLSARQAFRRERIVAAVEHKRAAGMSAAGAARDCLRDAAFTTLNRFVALKMLEVRDLVQECISKGEQSAGYCEFCGMAPGLPLLPDSSGYRLYIESLFDELSTEVKVLFDRRDPSSVLWPKRATFEQLLEILNATELARVWGEDETIGWVYQFFNGQDERRKMREESQAPRNSRELAVRNQFFTPRYVVQFLTDNTLGRLWFDMCRGDTALSRTCGFMMRGGAGNDAALKDPRDIGVLDPACGSGHFLLYAFDLFEVIYSEAWGREDLPVFSGTGSTLRSDYPTRPELIRALPGLILRYNLFGVDIDPRASQIAALALWLRAQRSYRNHQVVAAERKSIRKTNTIVAEPMPGEVDLRQEFLVSLDPKLAAVMRRVIVAMEIAADAGPLLRIEREIKAIIREVYGVTGTLFEQADNDAWCEAERQLLSALRAYGTEASVAASGERKRLFAENAISALDFIDVCRRRFDVVLMNPPFGEFIDARFDFLDREYRGSKRDIAVAFLERGLELAPIVGGLHSRKSFFLDTQSAWREGLRERAHFSPVADLGHRVLDNALVEVAASVIRLGQGESTFVQCLDAADKEAALREAVNSGPEHTRTSVWTLDEFACLPSGQFAYSVPRELLSVYEQCDRLDPSIALCRDGMSTRDNFRFLRLHWEIPDREGRRWIRIAKGGEYQSFYADYELLTLWQDGDGEMFAYGDSLGNGAVTRKGSTFYFRPALTYTERTASRLSVRILPGDAAFTTAGPGIVLQDPADAMALLGLLNSFVFAALYEVCIGGGDSVSSGSAARHYTPGGLGQMPVPSCQRLREQEWPTLAIAMRWMEHARHLETSPLFTGRTFAGCRSVADLAQQQLRRDEDLFLYLWDASRELEECALRAYGLNHDVLGHVASVVGPHPAFYEARQQPTDEFAGLYALSDDALVDRVAADLGNPRWAVVKSYVADRRYELLAHRWRIHPASVVEARRASGILPPGYRDEVARQIVSYAIGTAFGRWPGRADAVVDPLSLLAGGVGPQAQAQRRSVAILADDEGHTLDVVAAVLRAAEPDVPIALLEDAVRALSNSGELRAFLRRDYFGQHVRETTLHRRTAPTLWQLATPTGAYSVWLYLHSLSRDALFQVQTELVTPKLAHEDRRLESLTNEFRDDASASRRKELAAQEALVEELRTFLDEVKRVAPLWNPNLEDGVIINFAPLWRLVPQNKSWQKELKSTWDALCEGKYDWAHLAMHLWPERVVPKCARDRSLAIAHGLEDPFWVEGRDGKWTARKEPMRSVDELVHERTSPAVKFALKSLLEAPAAAGRSGGRRGGGRRKGAATAEGGDA